MATAKQLAAEAAKVLWKGAALITAADWEDGEVKRVQVYFESDGEAVMDTVDIKDLIDNFPEEGVFVLDPAGKSDAEALRQVRLYESSEDLHLRAVPTDEPCDDFGTPLPTVAFMEAVERISQLQKGPEKR